MNTSECDDKEPDQLIIQLKRLKNPAMVTYREPCTTAMASASTGAIRPHARLRYDKDWHA